MSYAAQSPAPYGGQAQAGDPGTLDLPYYGIGLVGAIKRAFAKYVRFDGRASRSEYWWWALFTGVIMGVLYGIAGGMVGGSVDPATGMSTGVPAGAMIFYVLGGLFSLVTLLPTLGLIVRRLHDQNLAGPFIFLGLIPGVGGLIIFILMLMPSKPEGTRFDR